MDCCDSEADQKYDFDLVFIGSGSAAFAGAIKAAELGKTVAIIERGIIGGTCVNVGCVPSKNLIRAAEAKHKIENSAFDGVPAGKTEIDFKKIIQGKDQLVSSLRAAKYQSILDNNELISLIEGQAKFVDPHTLDVSGKKVTADKIIISTGSSPFIPPIPGLKESGFLTSTSAFELKELPKTLAVLGGGYIALEVAQLFSRLGSDVTIIQRSEILFQEDDDVSEWMGKYLREEGIKILNKTQIERVEKSGAKTILILSGPHADKQL
ncbi:MAG: hypothetical protein COV38_00125, partial [Bdellovibrionales bacterium CG11_big_fil_rev_8_21_14_0_20_38_13]